MCLHAVGPGHRADEPGLQEGAPLVDQTAVTSVVVLFFGKGGGGHKNTVSPSVASSLALTPPPPDLKIKKSPGGATHTYVSLICKDRKLRGGADGVR